MRLETANRYVGEFECIIQSIYSGAKYYKPTSAKLVEEILQRVHDNPKYKKLPEWAKDKLYNTWHHIRKNTDEKYIRMFYIGLDGRKIPTGKSWDLFTEEEKQMQMSENNLPIHHLWMEEKIQRNDDGSEIITLTPTDKVYWHNDMK
jgi:hypothetical protein